jgi:DNA invertase Pin-like site-specific DNA recombinase
MRLGYIRIDKAGAARDEQEAALRRAGIADWSPDGPVYVDPVRPKRPKPGTDPLAARTEAIRALRPGDELVIHSAARLGTTRGDVLAALDAIGRAEAAVYDCAAAETVTPHPLAVSMIAFAARAESQGQQERAAKARRGITRRAGPPAALTGKKLREAEKLWTNPETSARQVADATGASVRTLYRRFGPKGTPVFGRKPRK